MQLRAGAKLATLKPAIEQTVLLYRQECEARRDAAVLVQLYSYIAGNLEQDFCIKQLNVQFLGGK